MVRAGASFLLLEIQARLTEQNNNYKAATRIRNRQLRLIGCEPALQNGRKHTETCYQLALLYLKQNRFAQALQSIESGLDRPGIKLPIFRRLTEIQVSVMILLDKTLLAISVLNNIAPDDKIYYLKAVTLFLLHDYAEALEIMENISYQKLDASGCGTPARILTQMLTIENYRESNNRFVIRKLKSLDRKMPVAVHLNAREQLIVDLMQALIIKNLDFKKVYQRFQGHIEKLRISVGETAWQPERGELIVFQEWFMAKVLNLPCPANGYK